MLHAISEVREERVLRGTDSEAPYGVIETEHLWIEMPDSVRLAGRLWQPDTDQPVPAILEYIPYRKADMVRARDERNHPFFAAHGYACIRVDMRGSGDSEGHMPDMYAPAELSDARAVIEWLATQPWCNGNVGMFGTSWGGTASLQASVNAPIALKAVIAVCATHDRFEHDIHYMGGSILSDTFEWGTTLPAILACPPTPEVGPDWKTKWQERLNNLSFPLEHWLRKKARGTYWRHGSVIHEKDALRVPILAVGGWSDRYSASVMDLADARPDLVWGVVGPWGHHYPDTGAPGPGIGFQRLALEWWDHWLRTPRSEPIQWPRLRSWLREFDPPGDKLDSRNGHWIATDAPAAETEIRQIALRDLVPDNSNSPWALPNDHSVGTSSGDTGYFGRPGGLPLDQSVDDKRALVFETAPMEADVFLFGAPSLSLQGHSDTGEGQIVARLCDVAPEGQSARISYGLRNIALTETLDCAGASPAAGAFDIALRAHPTAYRLRKNHRLRIALSGALWPLVLSRTAPSGIKIISGTLELPVFSGTPTPMSTKFPAIEQLPIRNNHFAVSAPPLSRWNESTKTEQEIGWHQPFAASRCHQTNTVFGYETRMAHTLIVGEEPDQEVTVQVRFEIDRPDGRAEISSDLKATCGDGKLSVTCDLEALWDGTSLGKHSFRISVQSP